MDMLYICWKTNTATIPPIAYLSVKFSVLLTVDINTSSKYIINDTRINPPIKPKLETNMENIKSVCISGKYIGVLLNPCPVNPLEPIAINELLSCNPLLLVQLRILSIL